MTSLSYGSNVGSLLAQSNLRKTTDSLGTSFERLSSGLRINNAKDDPAGLALSTDLNAKSRILTQAIRNANDGISLVSVAEVAATELTSLLSRLSELATQASNGTLTRVQRLALDDEAQELTEEYNRIVSNTEFNSMELLDGSFGSTTLQLSDDSQNNISFSVGAELGLTVGDGTFESGVTTSVVSSTTAMTSGDFNGDGRIDFVVSTSVDSLNVYLGDGDGTFASAVSYAGGDNLQTVTSADLDGDGDLDLINQSQNTDDVNVLLNNGDGTFAAFVSYDVGTATSDIGVGDVDGDGDIDIISQDGTNDQVKVLLNNGSGTFGAAITTQLDTTTAILALDVGDLNDDGILDLAMSESGPDSIVIALGNGDGTFQSFGTLDVGVTPLGIELADFNHDGILDVATVTSVSGSLEVLLGNGDGTFASSLSYSAGSTPVSLSTGDLNGDGHVDIVTASSVDEEVSVFFGTGVGSFTKSSDTYSAGNIGGSSQGLFVTDLDNDTVGDLLVLSGSSSEVFAFLGDTQEIQTLPRLDLTRADTATESLALIERAQDNVTLELGNLGAVSSRLDFTTSALTNIRDEYLTAESRITDADVAAEVAEMVRLQVLQQSGAAVLAQANANPQVALTLLTGGV